MNLTISSKGQVVIPAKLRKKYGLRPGSTVQVVDYGGVLALTPALDDPVRQQNQGDNGDLIKACGSF